MVAKKYQQSCAAVGLAPNSFILKSLELRNTLHIKIEKLQPEEWKPVLMCLENNSVITEVHLELITATAHHAYVRRSTKPSFNQAIKASLFKSLTTCLTCSSALKRLSIINVPLKKDALSCLVQGLTRNQSLDYLCLKGSLNGNKAFKEVFPIIRKSLNISHFDLSQCKLSEEACALIGSLLRSQILERHTETWKHTLRYNNPDVNAVTGIRRISLNGNPIGDEGCEVLSASLQDDYWLRAMDLQHCKITEEGAKMFLMLLEDNSSLQVLDLRLNDEIKDMNIVAKIESCLARNKQKSGLEDYQTGEIFSDSKVSKVKPKANKPRSIAKIKLHNSMTEARTPKKNVLKHNSQYEQYYNSMMKQSVVRNMESLNDIGILGERNKFSPILLHRSTPSKVQTPKKTSDTAKQQEEKQIFSMLDDLKNDLEVYKRDLYQEKEKSKSLELRLREVERENAFLKKNQTDQEREMEPELLETIETSFNQFHSFLDMLKQAGYGDLCKLVDKH